MPNSNCLGLSLASKETIIRKLYTGPERDIRREKMKKSDFLFCFKLFDNIFKALCLVQNIDFVD